MKKRVLPVLAVIVALGVGYGIGTQRAASPDDPVRSASSPIVRSFVTSTPKPTKSPTRAPQKYILNTSTKKFHKPECYSVKQMNESNKKETTKSRDEIIDEGYKPCGHCNP